MTTQHPPLAIAGDIERRLRAEGVTPREMMSILGTTATSVLYDQEEADRVALLLAHVEALFITFPRTGAAVIAKFVAITSRA